MTVATAPVRRSARTPKSWRSRGPWDICSLGWHVLDWTHDNLPDPRDRTKPLVLTNEQARRVLRIYELDPLTGRRLYSRVHEEEAKGWGKGPFAAFLAMAEFGGAPVVFDGWDAEGQPAGIPWGDAGLPPPFVQFVAVSMDQTLNAWGTVMTMAAEARSDLAGRVTVDSGRPGSTMLRRRDIPAARMERVTASAVSREGALLVHAVLDEVDKWGPANSGDELARVVVRNLDKSEVGWAHFLANAPIIGQESVAEAWGPAPDALHFATRPTEMPEPDWSPERLRAALEEVYEHVTWGDRETRIERHLASLGQAEVPWGQSLRFKFNVRTDAMEGAWMAPDLWESRRGDAVLVGDEPAYVCIRVGHQHQAAAMAVAQRQGDRVVLRMWTIAASEGAYVDAPAIEAQVTAQRVWRAPVIADVQSRPGGRTRKRTRPGPLLLHHEAFFEPSRQRLEASGMVTLGVPSSQERLTPAAETLMQLVTSGALTHDGDEETARQLARVVAAQRPKGWAVESASDEPIVAAHAAMLAVHWAMTAEKPEPVRAAY